MAEEASSIEDAVESLTQGVRSGHLEQVLAIARTKDGRWEFFVSIKGEDEMETGAIIIEAIGFMSIMTTRIGMNINLAEGVDRGPNLVTQEEEEG